MNRRTVLSRITVFMVILGSLCSCSDNPVSPDETTPQLNWEAWVNPVNDPYYSYWFNAIWGSSEGDLYVVGQQKMVLHYDGEDWEYLLFEDTKTLYDVWGNSQGDVYVVGGEGTIMHYDGQNWESMNSGTSATLYGIWGNSDYDMFTVGSGGTVLHYDGKEWSSIDTGTDQTLWDVWGDGSNIFAVGDNGMVLELDRDEAHEVESPTANTLYGIGGCPETGLCAVGAAGTILRYDGLAWSGVRSGTTASLQKVCGTSDGHLIVVGASTVLHFDGYQWEFMDDVSVSLERYGMVGVYGSSIRNMFVLGRGAIAHYDGSSWGTMELPTSTPGDRSKTLNDIWGSSGSDIYAVGAREGALRYDGSTWASAGGYGFDAVWGVAENAVFAVRTTWHEENNWGSVREWVVGTVSQYNGTDWITMQASENMSFNSIWGDSETDLFVVGSLTEFHSTQEGNIIRQWIENYPRIFRYNNGAWNVVYSKDTQGRMGAVWGSSETDVYATGSGGLLVHYDGISWTEVNYGMPTGLISIWGNSETDIFAVGSDGTILHCDGQDWTSMNSGTTETLIDVWGSSMSDVFAVGANGTILHYDGAIWQQMASPTINGLNGIWGSGPDDIFAVGQFGTILHYGHH